MSNLFNDPNNLREPKKKPAPLFRQVLTKIAIGLLCIVAALAGVWIANVAERESVNFRTDSSTEVHKVLGDVYAHMGDNVRIGRAPIDSIVYIHNKYIKTETCHGFTSNVFWGLDNHVVHHYSMFTNWFAAGTYEADEAFIIPKWLPTGRYRMIKKTVSICNGKEHYTVNYDLVIEFYDPSNKGSKSTPVE